MLKHCKNVKLNSRIASYIRMEISDEFKRDVELARFAFSKGLSRKGTRAYVSTSHHKFIAICNILQDVKELAKFTKKADKIEVQKNIFKNELGLRNLSFTKIKPYSMLKKLNLKLRYHRQVMARLLAEELFESGNTKFIKYLHEST